MLKNLSVASLSVASLSVASLSVASISTTNLIKSVKIFKSPLWLYCTVKIKNTPYKLIYPDELVHAVPYFITMEKYNNLVSVMCNDCIIYQQASWYAFDVEFKLAEPHKNVAPSFYECIIKDINYNNSNIYINN